MSNEDQLAKRVPSLGNLEHRAKDTKSNFGITHWMIIVMLMAFGYFANGSMNDGLNTYVGLFTEKFGWSSAQLLTYSTYAGWFSILGVIAYTQFTKRYGARKTAIMAMAIAIFAMTLWARSTSKWMYFVSIVLLVSSASAIMVIRDTTLNNWFPTKKGLALGWATMGPLIATATVLWLLKWGGGSFGFTGHFDIVSIGFFILLLLSIFWFRDHPEEKGCFPDNDTSMTLERAKELHDKALRISASSPWTTKKLLMTKQVWQVGVGVGGLNMLIGNAVMSQIIPTIQSYGFDRSEALMMMTVLVVCGLPLSYMFGYLDAKFGTRITILCFFAWCFVALLFMVLPGKWTVYVSIFMIGGYIGGSGNIMGAMTNTVFGRYDFARAFSVIYPICMAVRSCAYALIGNLREISGGYHVPYLVLMGVAVVAILNAAFMSDKFIGRDYAEEDNSQAAQAVDSLRATCHEPLLGRLADGRAETGVRG